MKGPLFWLAFGSAATTTLLVCWAAWVFMIQPMDAAVKTTNALEKVFSEEFEITPRLSANAGVLFSQTARVENIVTARHTVLVEKTIDMPLSDGSQPLVRAEFVGEAGIAGREVIDINIRRGGREADVKLPKTKLLNLEPASPPVVNPPGPAWDALPEHIRSRSLRQLRLAARQRLLDDGLLSESDRKLRADIEALAAKAGCRAVFSAKPE